MAACRSIASLSLLRYWRSIRFFASVRLCLPTHQDDSPDFAEGEVEFLELGDSIQVHNIGIGIVTLPPITAMVGLQEPSDS
jgi:hypothetical protein